MELNDLLKMGATLIEGNKDDATTGLDLDAVAKALNGVIMNSDGALDLAAIVGNLSKNGLGEIVGSWLGMGENKTISSEQITDLLGSDKIAAFASELGLSEESATQALTDALPTVVDKATTEEHSMVDEMLGGSGNAMEMLSKMFR